MEQKQKLKDKIAQNKDKALEMHKNFFNKLDKVKSYEGITKRIIEKSDHFVNDSENPFEAIDMNKILLFIASEKIKSELSGFANIFSKKEE